MHQDISTIDFPKTLFVTGIGTDVGKSYATAWLVKRIMEKGESVITQKFIQTGCREWSEDIETHRRLTGMPLTEDDINHTTAPVIFTYPASPHLAAAIDNRTIDFGSIEKATERLESRYSHVIVEGAGGIMVPLEEEMLTIDYIASHKLPVAVVVTGQLGSINHALMTLQCVKDYGIELFAVVYNPYFDKDTTICKDTVTYLKNWVEKRFPGSHFLIMDSI